MGLQGIEPCKAGLKVRYLTDRSETQFIGGSGRDRTCISPVMSWAPFPNRPQNHGVRSRDRTCMVSVISRVLFPIQPHEQCACFLLKRYLLAFNSPIWVDRRDSNPLTLESHSSRAPRCVRPNWRQGSGSESNRSAHRVMSPGSPH